VHVLTVAIRLEPDEAPGELLELLRELLGGRCPWCHVSLVGSAAARRDAFLAHLPCPSMPPGRVVGPVGAQGPRLYHLGGSAAGGEALEDGLVESLEEAGDVGALP